LSSSPSTAKKKKKKKKTRFWEVRLFHHRSEQTVSSLLDVMWLWFAALSSVSDLGVFPALLLFSCLPSCPAPPLTAPRGSQGQNVSNGSTLRTAQMTFCPVSVRTFTLITFAPRPLTAGGSWRLHWHLHPWSNGPWDARMPTIYVLSNSLSLRL
jgi:hypothetical protein